MADGAARSRKGAHARPTAANVPGRALRAHGTVTYLRETVGPDLASKIRARLGNDMFVALYADTAAA